MDRGHAANTVHAKLQPTFQDNFELKNPFPDIFDSAKNTSSSSKYKEIPSGQLNTASKELEFIEKYSNSDSTNPFAISVTDNLVNPFGASS